MFLALTIIGIIGLLFGSLSTVLIDRWHSHKGGILLGRSECPKCRHRLGARELIPLLSYAIQGGKCRHCKAHISGFYPLAELCMSAIFILLTYAGWSYFGIDFLSASHILLLVLGFVTGVYFLYDLLYMEIPDEIMVPAIFGYLGLLLLSLFIPTAEMLFFDRLSYGDNITYFVIDHIAGAWILYSFLYLQILIPGGWYLASRSRFKDLLHLIASYILFPLSLIVGLFSRKEKNDDPTEETLPTWVGGGDLRIALFIGLTLGTVHAIASFAFAYIIGSIIGIVLLIVGKLKKGGKNEVPFGPFLALGWILTIFFHESILEKVQNFLDYL